MRNLIDFLNKYNYWFVFIILELISLSLLLRFNSYQGSVGFTTANSVSGKILEWRSEAVSYLWLSYVNKGLTQRNVILEQRVQRLQAELSKLKQEPTYTETRQTELLANFSLIPAQVVDNVIKKKDNYITINKGEVDGVKPEMGVVCGTGVVGIVYMTAPHYSIVMPILNSKSNISCRIRGKGYFGYLRWDGGKPLYCTLNDVPLHAQIKIGDVVETSGFSAVFPSGIFVGKVARLQNSEDGLSYGLTVHLGTDFAKLWDVCVVATPNKVELDELQQEAEKIVK